MRKKKEEITVHQGLLYTESGRETLYRSFELLYKDTLAGGKTEIVYCPVVRRTGRTPVGFQPYYRELPQLLRKMELM